MYIILTQELETSIYKNSCFICTTVLQQKFILQADLWVQGSNYYRWIYLWALQTHFRTTKHIKAPTAIQESIIYMDFNQKPSNDRWLQTFIQKWKSWSCFKHCTRHYHFLLHLVSLLNWDQNLLTFPTISSMLGLPLTHLSNLWGSTLCFPCFTYLALY